MYLTQPLKTYLDDLAARKSTPGGGSAAALAGASAAALVSMVCNFTLGKEKYQAHEAEIKSILAQSEAMRAELERLIDKDVEAYNQIAQAGREVNDTILKQAESIPEQVCKHCLDGSKLCAALVDIGNRNLISDVGVAAEFFLSAFLAARLNVEINLKFIKDKKFSAIISSHLKSAEKQIQTLNQKIGVKVGKAIRG
ncbi:MAG: cyclodeaminase/cyclohydrolase family protein [Candidatus Omnitrophota bacterium]